MPIASYLIVRQAQERPEGFEEGAVMMVGMNLDRIINGLNIIDKQARDHNRQLNMVADYAIDNVSDKVVRIILSYVDFIKQRTWKQF